MEVSSKKINLSFINDARILLLGVATLLVTFFHTYELNYLRLINQPIIANIIHFFKSIGNYGVDIFLFLSGIGLYISMSKNKIGKFYKNRFVRIIPKYLIVLIIYSLFVENFNLFNVIQYLIGLPYFVDGLRDGWYITFIMGLYLIFPLIYKIFKKYDIYALFVSLLIIIMFNLMFSIFLPDYYFRWEVGLTRIPVFLVGTFFGKKVSEGSRISLKMIKFSFIIHLIILIILYLNIDLKYFAIYARYLYCPLAVCSVINISWLYSLLKNKNSLLLKPIKFIGNCSLEMYLFYEKICYVLFFAFSVRNYVNLYLLAFIISLIMSYLINKIFSLSLKNFFNKKLCKM